MLKLTLVSPFRTILLLSAILGSMLLPAGTACCQTSVLAEKNKSLLPDDLGENWRATDAPRTLTADQCSILPDGDVYAEYGLESLASRHFANGKSAVAIEIFRMKFATGAHGLLTFNRGRQDTPRYETSHGNYLISVLSETQDEVPYQSLIQVIKNNLGPVDGEISPLPDHLPEQYKLPHSEKYLVGPVALSKIKGFADFSNIVNFAGGTEIVIADYNLNNEIMGLMIVEYHTPQLATDGFDRFKGYLQQLSPQEKNSRVVKRIGNYVVAAINVQNPPIAEEIISKIKYNPKVYWEGRDLKNVPLAFRPPDPIAIEEASQTAKMLVRTFYWIGVMLLGAIVMGVFSGGLFFYWNRYRRRKLGLDDIFSDAGGTIRLNLDDYLLSSEDPHLKELKK